MINAVYKSWPSQLLLLSAAFSSIFSDRQIFDPCLALLVSTCLSPLRLFPIEMSLTVSY